MKYFFKVFLPKYIKIPFSLYWIAIWSAPTTPASLLDYIKCLRITLRFGRYHSKLIFVIKNGFE